MRIRFDCVGVEFTAGEFVRDILAGSMILAAIYGLCVLLSVIG